MSLFRTKTIEETLATAEESEHRLKRSLSAFDLTVIGVGVIIGTGIFVLTGQAAATKAGPAIAISFVLSGIACALAAMCYAEFASTIPVAGSAYTFSYASLGEIIAWIIGWDLALELAVGGATVAIGWSQYFQSALDTIGIHLPRWLAGGHGIDLPAGLIVLILAGVLTVGMKVSARLNTILVGVKIAVVLFFLGFGVWFISAKNYHPFVPPAHRLTGTSSDTLTTPLLTVLTGSDPTVFGFGGIIAGAAVVFFAYAGFDIVATASEETKNPKRDLPRGIIGSLAVCSILYVAVTVVLTGIVKYTHLGGAAPMADALKATGNGWAVGLVSLGAIAGLTTVVMIDMLGQSRVFFAMSRDRLLPAWLGQVHPRFGTPHRLTVMVGVIVAAIAMTTPVSTVANLVSIGTLAAFVMVSIGVFVLRRKRPELKRGFRVPALPVVSVCSVLACGYLMLNLAVETWIRFVGAGRARMS